MADIDSVGKRICGNLELLEHDREVQTSTLKEADKILGADIGLMARQQELQRLSEQGDKKCKGTLEAYPILVKQLEADLQLLARHDAILAAAYRVRFDDLKSYYLA